MEETESENYVIQTSDLHQPLKHHISIYVQTTKPQPRPLLLAKSS